MISIKINVILAFAAMILWGIGDFFIQRTVRKVGSMASIAWLSIVGSIGLFPFVIKDLHEIGSWPVLWPLFVLGVLLSLNALFFNESLKIGKLSVVEVVLILELPLTIILGVVVLGDEISLPQLLLMTFLIAGVIASSVNFNKLSKYNLLEKGTLLMVMAAAFLAFVNLFTAIGSRQVSSFLVIWFPWTISSILAVVYLYFKKGLSLFWTNGREFRNLIILTGIIDIAAWLSYSFAVSKGELSITTAITESYPVIAMLLGIKLNREDISVYQLLGGIVVLGAGILLGAYS